MKNKSPKKGKPADLSRRKVLKISGYFRLMALASSTALLIRPDRDFVLMLNE